MRENKEIRKQARENVKKNYFVLVFVCIIMMFFAGCYSTSMRGIKNLLVRDFVIESQINNTTIDALNDSNFDITSEILKTLFFTDDVEQIRIQNNVTDGIFRTIFDIITNAEKFLFKIIKYIMDFIVNIRNEIVLGVLILIIQLLYNILVAKPLRVCQARIFLESRLYSKTPFERIVYIKSKKEYFRIVKTIFLLDIYQILWDFTIIGGVIKRYSYRLVPMIMAENSNIKSTDAITLSRKMMQGHKSQLFLLDISMLLYGIIDLLTFGIFGILFKNSYYTSAVIEFYSSVKEEYISKDNKNLIFDELLTNNQDNLQCYPGAKIKEKRNINEVFDYYRNYSITTLILFFFSFAFIGWLWEVGIHIFKDGRFINRGTMLGPWLPIYGFGCLFVLIILLTPKKLRKITDNPLLTFLVVMLICATLEYFTSFVLEFIYGMRWWDYTGYFLNINGRICFEGMIFFGLGGCLCIYIVAPFLEKKILKIPNKIKIVLCIILVSLFLCDFIYSMRNPNMGVGITEKNRYIEYELNKTE